MIMNASEPIRSVSRTRKYRVAGTVAIHFGQRVSFAVRVENVERLGTSSAAIGATTAPQFNLRLPTL